MSASTAAFKDELYVRLVYRRCHYCFRRLLRHEATVDHKVPKALGGPTHRSNFVLACSPCNQRKGAMPYDIFKARMQPVKRRRKKGRHER